jgi:hypothetical protein
MFNVQCSKFNPAAADSGYTTKDGRGMCPNRYRVSRLWGANKEKTLTRDA